MRALVIADVHSNLDALNAVLHAAGTFDEVWCLGDIVGYGPEPISTLASIRELEAVTVAGNHDRGATRLIDRDWFNPAARQALERHGELLSATDTSWLDGLPLVREHHQCTLCHGSLADPIRDYLRTASDAADTVKRAKTSVVLTGHTHIPAVWRQTTNGSMESTAIVYGKPITLGDLPTVINPGSVGQPRDGNPAACFALVDTVDRTILFDRVNYPVRRMMRKMQRLGYPQSTISRYGEGR